MKINKQYISPITKVKRFSIERTGIMVQGTIPKGDSEGPVIEDGEQIEAKKFNFNVWDEE